MIVELLGGAMPATPAQCPSCGDPLANVQGIDVCVACDWTATR